MHAADSFDRLPLMQGEIHLWRLDLLAAPPQLDRYWNLLDSAERERAGRAATEILRRRVIVTQGALRSVLARYLGKPPETIRFERGSYGKPHLAGNPPDHGLVFNISHSGGRAIFAIGRDMALGVDLELWRPLHRPDAMAERCLASSERNYWYSLPETDQCRAFFDFWTAKEAFVKAVGRGLGLGLTHCVLASGDATRLIAVPEFCGAPEEWSIWRLNPGEQASSALCARTRHAELRMLDFDHG
jgi:4'-phosphopantetheinyl transferase